MRLVARDLSYRHRGSTEPLLTAVNHQWSSGKMSALVGPSGAGKSTLLDLLGGIRLPHEGAVQLEATDGTPRVNLTREQHQLACAWVLQSNLLLKGRTVLENVALTMRFQGHDRRTSTMRAARVLIRLGLGRRLRHVPSELSGGEQQRVTIARSLLSTTPVLLADEPTGNLDAANTRRVVQALRAAADDGKIVIVATHDPSVYRVCDDVLDLRPE